jgi:hypothetical protein
MQGWFLSEFKFSSNSCDFAGSKAGLGILCRYWVPEMTIDYRCEDGTYVGELRNDIIAIRYIQTSAFLTYFSSINRLLFCWKMNRGLTLSLNLLLCTSIVQEPMIPKC